MAKLKFTLCKVIEIGATGDQTCHDSSRQSVPHGRPLNQCCYRQERLLQDIMTPLCALLSSYSQDWGPADSSHPPKTEKQKVLAQKIDSKTEIFIESVNLLWNLCEACPLALNIVNEKIYIVLWFWSVEVRSFSHMDQSVLIRLDIYRWRWPKVLALQMVL